jgi:hypothetical protein
MGIHFHCKHLSKQKHWPKTSFRHTHNWGHWSSRVESVPLPESVSGFSRSGSFFLLQLPLSLNAVKRGEKGMRRRQVRERQKMLYQPVIISQVFPPSLLTTNIGSLKGRGLAAGSVVAGPTASDTPTAFPSDTASTAVTYRVSLAECNILECLDRSMPV